MHEQLIEDEVAVPRPFAYVRPELERSKHVVMLARTDRMLAAVQVLRSGGENNLHAHPNQDGFWMVLKGRVRYYGEGDVLLGSFGPMEGILIPRGSKYWFESEGDEVLEILQVQAFEVPMKDLKTAIANRINLEPVKTATRDFKLHEGRHQ